MAILQRDICGNRIRNYRMKLGLPVVREAMAEDETISRLLCNLSITRLLWKRFPQQSRSRNKQVSLELILNRSSPDWQHHMNEVQKMGYCKICGKETEDSAVIYQAVLINSTTTQSKEMLLFVSSEKTTTVKKYKDVMQYTGFCCKNCKKRDGSGAVDLFVLTLIGAGITVFCIWGGPWYNHLPYTPIFQGIQILCVLGALAVFLSYQPALYQRLPR